MEKRIHFMDQLVYAKEHGIDVDVEGISYSDRRPNDVVAVMQRGNYMVDYESDYRGRITAIHINSIDRAY